MHIIYAAATCSERTYEALFAKCPQKPAFQSQKYHRLLIEGLAAQTEVDVAATLPVNRSNCHKACLRLEPETEGGARYHYAPASGNPILKLMFSALGTFGQVLTLSRKDSVLIVDCLNCTTAFFAQLAARLRGIRCVGIVTDLPELLNLGRFYGALSNRVIARCTDYVFLTERMNGRLNQTNKPYIVLEGHADSAMAHRIPSLALKRRPRVCLYAGSVCGLYGLPQLVEGFQKADPDANLVIYGQGDFVDTLKEIAERDTRILYGGMLLSSQVVEKEMEATLLVNPRPTDEEYVQYSFPSKTMEYMASGTPVLTTRLPGMPEEYYPYVNFIDDETPDGIAAALKDVLGRSDEALFAQGLAAREFVLTQRNNRIQAKKILDLMTPPGRS